MQKALSGRYKTEEVNEYFLSVLRQYIPRPGMAALFRDVVCDTYNNSSGTFQTERKQYIQEITDQNNRLAKSRELLLKDIMDGD